MSSPRGTGPGPSPGPVGRTAAGRTDLGRRLAAHRAAAGLSRRELGERCGADEHYIAYLEDHVAVPSIGTLVRLADALGTSVEDLAGMGNRPVPVPVPEDRPLRGRLITLDEGACRRLLGLRGIARVAVFTAQGPALHPVNYLVAHGDIAFLTGAGTVLARAAGTEAAIEVEGIDEVAARGWSVLAVGELRAATAQRAELERLAEEAHSTPWAGGERDQWMALTPVRLTGRRVVSR